MSRRASRAAVAALSAALLLAALVAVADGRANAINPAPLNAALRSGRMKSGAPGAEAAIVACGQVVWAGADGITDLRSKRKVTNSTPFVIASTTKTVTAAMIMQLVQAGPAAKLSLDTRLSRFYPKLPNAGKITLRMLLSNTSGLGDYADNSQISDLIANAPRHRWTRSEVIAGIGKSLFTPGTKYKYTNSNWVVLGGILEKVTGTSVESYFQRMIARPAGMKSSTFTRNRATQRVMAQPYTLETDGERTSEWIPGFGVSTAAWGPVWTDGGLVSTATDLARFGNALLGARLVSAATVAEMIKVVHNDEGLGIETRDFDGRPWFGHSGAYGGYESENWTDPKRQVTITITTNMEEADDTDDADVLSEQILVPVMKAYDRSRPTSCVRPAARRPAKT